MQISFLKKILQRGIVISTILLCWYPASAQLFNFRNYSLDDGLSQSEINCIYEDSRGYLWIGTSGGGLCRFDGKEFKTYEEKDGLCGSIITAVSEDKDHSILIANRNGDLCRFDGSEFKRVENINNKITNHSIRFIIIDDNQNTIIGKDDQIIKMSGKNAEPLPITGDTLSYFDINCYKKDSRNILWIGTNKGLLVLKNQTLLRVPDMDYIANGNITSLSEDVDGNLWAVENETHFYKIRIVGPSHYQVKVSKIDSIALPPDVKINDIHFDHKDQLWIATRNKGIYKLAANELTNFNQNNGLPVDNAKDIFEDRSGNLWFGTSGGGLVKFTSQAFTYFDNLEGFREKDIFTINADKKNNIWIGTSLHGVYRFDGKHVVNLSPEMGIGNSEVRAIYTDSKGNVWIGTAKGVIRYDGTFHKMPFSSCEDIRVFFEDKSGKIWIGTRGHSLFVYDGKNCQQITGNEGLGNDNIYSILEDKNGKIWLGTGNGVFVYHDGKITDHYGQPAGLCNVYAGCMIMDKFGAIWVGTDNCVARFNGTSFKSITTNEGLTSGTVYLINTDSYGNIWVGTNKGLDKISLTDKGEIESIRNYGKNEGFKGIECNSRATCTDQDGCLWFGTVKGAIKFDPREELIRKPEVPAVYITDVRLFYDKVDWKKYSDTLSGWFSLPINPRLAYNENHLTFDFAAISKTLPENIRYSYELEGFDREWSPFSEQTSTTYSNLPPGKYRFLVKASSKAGIVSNEPTVFEFQIRAPFWTTWWFIIFCIIGTGAAIYLYNEYRKKKHELYLERLESIIKQRTAEIIKQRDENEILLKEVHHRVKNNLQIINSLINIQSDYVNDARAAELFREIRNRIRTISLVHEKLYKSTDYGNINVKEYIHMLVENLIDTYSINKFIKLKLDLEVQHFNLNTIIPLGLLLNEIISNSFKYAFEGMENGKIEIELHKSTLSDEYTIIIGDNGKGYDRKLLSDESSTLGLELIKILAGQLNGTIERIEKPGTYYILKFKPLKD
ncbi:MAG: two-component regulator propeller domain-containing protein [Bacteroidia bacterium]